MAKELIPVLRRISTSNHERAAHRTSCCPSERSSLPALDSAPVLRHYEDEVHTSPAQLLGPLFRDPIREHYEG